MAKRCLLLIGLGCASALLSGCPKGSQEAKAGQQAEALQDYDNALIHYQRALREQPTNAEYKLNAERLRFDTANYHFRQGVKAREKGDLQGALAEFQKASAIDPSNALAAEEAQKMIELLGMKLANPPSTTPELPPGPKLAEGPPKLMPLGRMAPVHMTNDAKIVFDTIAKLSGLTVVFDTEFSNVPRRITVDLPSVTYQEALDITAMQAKAFWKPVTTNVIFVADAQKRKDYEEDVVRTFRLSNITTDKDMQEIVTAIRGIFNTVQRISAVPSQSAIVVRDTPDRVLLIGKLIDDLDKAKPEVVIQVEVLQASRDRIRDLGIQPTGTNSVTFNPPSTTTTSTSTTGTTTTPTSPTLQLNQLKHLSTSDYSVTLPSATVNTLLTDSTTKIIQNPELRSVDNVKATLRIGTRVPIATGSFQAGLGAGTVGTGSLVSPLVNTQFQYQDVGVNVDATPRILANRDVALILHVEVSSVTGTVSIGGINQPEISQRVIDQTVRLKDGEANILGGFIERTISSSVSGWPGLANIPLFRYLFSADNNEHESDEVLIVLIPHVVRMPSITEDNLRSIMSGTDTNPYVREVQDSTPTQTTQPSPTQPQGPAQAPTQNPIEVTQTPGVPVIAAGPTVGTQPPMAAMNPGGPATVRFDPASINLKVGGTTTIAVVVENVKDLASIPLMLQYNPAVISVEEVRHGGFLSGDTQEALVQRIDQQHGTAIISATRMQNMPGVNGTGTVVAVVIRAIAPGDSKLSIVQVNAKDSAQRAIPLVTAEGNVRVQ